jgi:cell division protein YceG involved in septum cleavage
MLYFVAKDDGSRRHYFTATHQEHLRMKQRARETREKPDAP